MLLDFPYSIVFDDVERLLYIPLFNELVAPLFVFPLCFVRDSIVLNQVEDLCFHLLQLPLSEWIRFELTQLCQVELLFPDE